MAALKYGFHILKLDQIVAFPAAANARSRNVMEKIVMHRTVDDDFYHPQLAVDDKLRRHVLYRIRRKDWESQLYTRQITTGRKSTIEIFMPSVHGKFKKKLRVE